MTRGNRADNLQGYRVRDLRDFRFQVIELGENANEEQVAEIFVRINSEGVKLSQADFILTLMSVYWEDGRRALEDFARACVDPAVTGNSPKNDFIDPGPDQLLRAGVALAFGRGRLANVYQLLRGKDLDTGEVSPDRRTAQFRELAAAQDNVLDLLHWHEFLKCLKLAGFRNHKMISSFNAIIYTYALWLIGRCHHGIEVTALRPVIARWFFMVQTTGRYTSSPESAIESDLRRLERIAKGAGDAFCEELDRIIRANFTTDYWDITLPSALDTAASRSPALFAYWAALNILDAEALFSNLNIRDLIDSGTNSKKGIERHHLFPQAFLKAKGVTSRAAINAIANMSFVDWPEHAPIGAQDPADYWQEAIAGMSSDRLHQHIKWHALPTGWEQLDFETFKERRRERIAQVVKEGFYSLFEEPGQVNLKASVAELAQLDESQTLEFKSTARWNVRANQADKKMEHIVLKTVCGFLNAEGGKLLIGIDDDGNAVGLEPDYSTLKKSDRDGYQLWLRQYIESNLSIPTAKLIRIGFGTVGNHDVAVVTIAPSGKPAFAKGPGDQQPNEFWVRIGNQTKQLHGDKMVEYQGQHWS